MFVLAPSAELALGFAPRPLVTIEAEYGSVVAEGTLFTAAHHQKDGPFSSAAQPSPCNNNQIPIIYEDGGIVLLSHFDLDSVGGALRTQERFQLLFTKDLESFWKLAEFVDLHGPHRLVESGANDQDILALHAWWAWSRNSVPRFARDVVTNITEFVEASGQALMSILRGDPLMMELGALFKAERLATNAQSFRLLMGPVIVRISNEFVNDLYSTPMGTPREAVAALNEAAGSVTISLANPERWPHISCREIVQRLWGPEAGGHAGIAGSPREKKMTEDDLMAAARALADAFDGL